MNYHGSLEISPSEEFKENSLITKQILKKKKKLYYILISLGYASLVAQLISAKFVFTNCNSAFASIFKHVFNIEVDKDDFSVLSFLLTFLDSTKDVTSIFPEKDARVFLGLEINNEKLVLKGSEHLKQNLSVVRKLNHCDHFKELALISIPVLAMAINFTNTAMPSWISMNTWIGDDQRIDIPIGITLLICHTSYFFLLSAHDVFIGFRELRNIKQSPFGLLFKFSKLIFSAPLIKIIIAGTYRATRSAYTFDEFMTKVMHIKHTPTRTTCKIIAAVCSALVLVFSRSLASFKHYLKPIQTGEDEYKVDLIQTQQTQIIRPSNCNTQKKILYVPIAVIRSLAIAFIMFGIFYNLFKENVSETGSIAISGLSSLFLCILVFMQVYSSETRHENNELARKSYEEQINPHMVEEKSSVIEKTNSQRLANFISLSCNFGNQATEALITVVGMITLLGPFFGNQNAAILGLMVGTESGWVNFHYFKSKIETRVSQIIDRGSQITSSLINTCHHFWYARNYQMMEEIHLDPTVKNSSQDEFQDSHLTRSLTL